MQQTYLSLGLSTTKQSPLSNISIESKKEEGINKEESASQLVGSNLTEFNLLEALPPELIVYTTRYLSFWETLAVAQTSCRLEFFISPLQSKFQKQREKVRAANNTLRMAIKEQNEGAIINAIRAGALPPLNQINQKISVKKNNFYSENDKNPKEYSLVEILINRNEFAFADYFIANGAVLPDLEARDPAQSTSEYFQQLSIKPNQLYLALKHNPNLISVKGNDKETLLHHVVLGSGAISASTWRAALRVLFSSPGFDLNAQDKEGNTAIHSILLAKYEQTLKAQVLDGNTASHSIPLAKYEQRLYEVMLPILIGQAIYTENFDFNLQNIYGFTILMFMVVCEDDEDYSKCNRTENFLEDVPKKRINLNILDHEGKSALFHAISNQHFEEAKTLLAKGASVSAAGSQDALPLSIINKTINDLSESSTDYDINIEIYANAVETVGEIKRLILEKMKEESEKAE